MNDLYAARYSLLDESTYTFLKRSNDGKISFFGERGTQGKKTTADSNDYNQQQHLEQVKKPLQEFCTGSRYIGKWNKLGMAGPGIYRYPHGVIYKGNFNMMGEFHGAGTLIYPNGQKLEGIWERGKLKDSSYIFSCGEVLSEDFAYCEMPDRRFHVEVENYFAPAGQEYLTNDQTPGKIPDGCYDTVDGFYNPKTLCVEVKESRSESSTVGAKGVKPLTLLHGMDDEQIEAFININMNADTKAYKRKKSDEVRIMGKLVKEIPSKTRTKWIKQHCRKPGDEPTGYRPDIFENWTIGKKNHKYSREFKNPQQIKSNYNVTIQEPPEIVSFIKKPLDMTDKRVSAIARSSSIVPKINNKKDLLAVASVRHKRSTAT